MDIDLDELKYWQKEIQAMKGVTYHCSNCRADAENEHERRLASYAEDLIPQLIQYFESNNA